MKILFTETAWSDYLYWQHNDRKITEKINDLLKNIQHQSFKGIGKPEPLKYVLSGFWSRRINQEHRLVYKRVFEKFHAASRCKAMRSRAVIKTNQGPDEPCELGIGAQNRSLHVVNEDSSTAATQQMPPKETSQTPSKIDNDVLYIVQCRYHY